MNEVFVELLENYNDNDKVIHFMVGKLKIYLSEPEKILVKQFDQVHDDKHDGMFYVIKGETEVLVKDKQRLNKQDKPVQKLFPGDHFGEIALVFDSARWATVRCTNYSTLAVLHQKKFNEIVHKYPEFTNLLKNKIFEYKDGLKMFLESCLLKVDYFQQCDQNTLNEIVFHLKQEHYEADQFIFKTDDYATKMYIVQNGIVHILT